jgi:hypothetical protein
MPETSVHQTSQRSWFMATRRRRVLANALLFGAIAAVGSFLGSFALSIVFGLFSGLCATVGLLASEESIRRTWCLLQFGFPVASDL